MKRMHSSLGAPLMMGLLTTSLLYAQGPQTPTGPGNLALAGPAGPHKPHGPHQANRQALTALTTVAGTFQQLTANDDFIADGFTLNTGTTTTQVRFPSNLGQAIQAAAQVGQAVTVTGFAEITPTGENVFRLAKLEVGKTVIVNATPPTPPANQQTPTPKTVTAKVADYQLDREGQAKGLILSDQTTVRMPPHLAGQLISLAPKGTTVTVEGYVKPLGQGQVMLQKHDRLEASVLTVNGQAYWVR